MDADKTWFQYREKEEEITIIGKKDGKSVKGKIYNKYIPADQDTNQIPHSKHYKASINYSGSEKGFISFLSDNTVKKPAKLDFPPKTETEKAYLEFGEIIDTKERFKNYLIDKAREGKDKKLDTSIPRHLDPIKRDKDLQEIIEQNMEPEEDNKQSYHQHSENIPKGFKGVERIDS